MERVLGREAQPAAQSLWLLACKHCCFGSLGLFRFVTWQARHREAEPCPELQGRDGASVSWGRGLGGGSDAGPTTPGRGARGQTHIWGGILAASLRRRHMPKKGLGWARGVRVGGAGGAAVGLRRGEEAQARSERFSVRTNRPLRGPPAGGVGWEGSWLLLA